MLLFRFDRIDPRLVTAVTTAVTIVATAVATVTRTAARNATTATAAGTATRTTAATTSDEAAVMRMPTTPMSGTELPADCLLPQARLVLPPLKRLLSLSLSLED